jgi:hypothetical protein
MTSAASGQIILGDRDRIFDWLGPFYQKTDVIVIASLTGFENRRGLCDSVNNYHLRDLRLTTYLVVPKIFLGPLVCGPLRSEDEKGDRYGNELA